MEATLTTHFRRRVLQHRRSLSRDTAMQAAAGEVKGPLQILSGPKDQLAGISTHLTTLRGIANDIEQVPAGCTAGFEV